MKNIINGKMYRIGEPEDTAERPWQDTSHELKPLFGEICQSCPKYGLCQDPDYREKMEKKGEESMFGFDEELPF